MEFTILFLDRQVVDAGIALLHQAVLVEFPVLIAVRPIPMAGIVVPFIGKAHSDAVVGSGPDFLDQAVIELLGPFTRQETDDLLAAGDEFGAFAPRAVRGIGQRHANRIAAVPAIIGGAHLLAGGFGGERRQGRALLGHGMV